MDGATQSSSDVTDFSEVNSTPLDLDDLFDVKKELIPVYAKWRSIGIALRLKPNVLDGIKAENNGDPPACLTSTVTEWLNRNYNVKRFGEPTWQALVKAVGDPAGGATMALARDMATRHKAGSPPPSFSPPPPSLEPAVVTYSPPHLLPQPHLAATTHEQSKAVVFAHENRQAITAKFAAFQTKVCNKLFKNGVNTKDLQLFVTNQFPPGDCIPQSPSSLTEVFEAITHHRLWDFFHYSPLVRIVQTFGANDPEMKGWVQTYKQDLKAYQLVTTVEEYIEADLDVADTPSAKRARYDPRYYTPLEWKTKFVDHTLQYLADVWELFSSHYLVPDSPPTALLERVRRGCFSVTWLVPTGLIPQLVKRVQLDTEFFQKHRILKVTVGKECVYKEIAEEITSSESYFESMAGITLDDCSEEFNLADDILDTKCNDEHILAVSSFLDWKGVARYLKLNDSEVGEVESDGRDEQDKRYKTLQKWMSKFAFKATYRNLIQALLDSGRGDHAEKVCKLLQKDVLGSQEAAAIGEKNARDSGEPRQKYRRVMPPDSSEEVQKYQITSLRAEIEDLKEQLQAKEDKLLQKDTELSALQVQLRDSKSDFETFQTQLGLPLKLNWKRSSDLPFAMCSSTIRPVTLKGKVYMVGRRIGVAEGTVVVYDTYSGKWSLLPKRHDQIKSFGMAVVKNQLTLVGGFDQLNHKVFNKLAVWESEGESEWTFPYPPMPTARYDVAVATYNEWMAVAGGQGDNGYLDSVEILNSTEKQWYSAAPLPMRCTPMKSAVVRDEWYLIVCYNPTMKIDQGFAVSLPALILFRGNASSKTWRNIPSAPLMDTAALATRDSLFAVGGRTRSTKIISSAIYLYLPWMKKWIEAGRLQTERASCTCIELPSGEILVAGGSEPKCGGPSRFTHTNRVDIATFMDL